MGLRRHERAVGDATPLITPKTPRFLSSAVSPRAWASPTKTAKNPEMPSYTPASWFTEAEYQRAWAAQHRNFVALFLQLFLVCGV
jgi:hypothetical protein